MKCQALGGKAGTQVIGILAVNEEDDLLLIASDGKLVRVHAADISKVGRGSAGIYVMRTEEGETLTSIQRVTPEEELQKAAENAEESGEEIFGEEVPDLPETEEEENLPEEETPEDDK